MENATEAVAVEAPKATKKERKTRKPKASVKSSKKAKKSDGKKKAKAPKKAKRLTEDVLLKRYPHMVKGTLKFDAEEQRNRCKIKCQERGCKKTREVATSDLFQVKRCEEHTKSFRNAKRKKNA